jgi:hypothetical protein
MLKRFLQVALATYLGALLYSAIFVPDPPAWVEFRERMGWNKHWPPRS